MFYETEEKGMAPGVGGYWPRIIPKTDSPHGRLVRVDDIDITGLIAAVRDFINADRTEHLAARLNDVETEAYERMRKAFKKQGE